MGIYSTPQNIRPISSTYPRRQAQSHTRSQTYPGININTQPNSHPNIQSQSPTNLTLENASLHSQLIALRRELARREAKSLRERRDAEVGAGTRLSPQFYSQVPAQNQFQTQAQFQGHGQSQYQTQTPIQSQMRLLPTESYSVLRAAIEDLHASIREFADVYGCSDLFRRGSGKGSEKGRHDGEEKVRRGGDRIEVWSEIPAILKSGVKEIEMQRGVFLPAVLRNSHSSKRSSRRSSGSSSTSSEGRSGDRRGDRERDSRERNRETGVQTLLAALLTREIYLAMWENAFFLEDEPNAVRTRYKERKKASASAASGLSGGRRDSRDSKDGKGGRRDSRNPEDGRDSRDGRDRRDERRKSGGEVDAAIRMITRSTILGDTFRGMWNYSPPSALAWRTQYFSVRYQELLASSSHSSLSPSTSTSTINHTLLTFTSTLTSCLLSGELAPLFRRLSSKEDMVMQKELCRILGRAVGVFVRLGVAGGKVEVGDVGEGLRMGYWRGGVGGEMVGLGDMRGGRGYGGMDRSGFDKSGFDELDGRRVDVVVSPPVYVFGDRRVLVPAVVVVEDDW